MMATSAAGPLPATTHGLRDENGERVVLIQRPHVGDARPVREVPFPPTVHQAIGRGVVACRTPEGSLFVLDATLARVTQENEYSPILKKQTDGSRIRQPLRRVDRDVLRAESWYCQAGTPRPFVLGTRETPP